MTAVVGGTVPLVGREDELEQLRSWFDEARSAGAARLGLVEGPSGVGKTRLLQEFAAEVEAQGGTALYGAAHDGGFLAYQPWVEATRRVLTRESPAGVADLVAGIEPQLAAIPWLADFLAEATPHAGAGADLSTVSTAVAGLIARLAGRGPVLVIVEDVQWADPGSLDLLEALRGPGDAGYLIVTAERRPATTVGGWRKLVESGAVQLDFSLTLDALDGDACERLVTAACGDSESSRTAARAIFDASGGNTFIALQLAGTIDPSAADPEAAAASVPAGAAELWASRLAPLSRVDRRVMTAAAVIGAEFDRELLVATDGDEAAVSNALDVATRAGLILSGPTTPNRYRFVHALAREHLYEAATDVRVARLHRRMASTLEARERTPPPMLVFHFGRAGAGQEPKIFEYSVGSVHWSLTEGSPATAREYADRALALLDRDEVRGAMASAHLETRLGDGLVRLGRTEGTEILTRLGRAALDAGDLPTAAQAAIALLRCDLGVGFGLSEDVAAFGFDLRDRVDELDDKTAALILAGLVNAFDQLPSQYGRLELSDEALVRARQSGDLDTLAFALSIHVPPWVEGLDRRLASTAELIELGRRHNRPEFVVVGLYMHYPLLIEKGRISDAAGVIDELERIATQLPPGLINGLRNLDLASDARAMVAILRTCHALILGRLDEAEVHVAEVADYAGQPDQQNTLLQLTLPYQLGHIADARGTAGIYADFCTEAANERPDIPVWKVLSAHVLADAGRLDDARPYFEAVIADRLESMPRDQLAGNNLIMLARVAYLLDDADGAEVVASRLRPYSGLISCNGSATRGPADYGLGLLALTQGRIDDAAKLLSGALDQARRCDMAVSEAQILVALAALAHQQGDQTAAEEHGRVALVICNDRGLAGIEADARRFLPARAT